MGPTVEEDGFLGGFLGGGRGGDGTGLVGWGGHVELGEWSVGVGRGFGG